MPCAAYISENNAAESMKSGIRVTSSIKTFSNPRSCSFSRSRFIAAIVSVPLAFTYAVLAACEGVSVAAKTGTAQIINPVSKSYEDGTSLASTIALVPADDPKYIIYFAVSAPRGDSIWGANVAAPSCAAVINGLVNQGKIRSEKQTVVQLN